MEAEPLYTPVTMHILESVVIRYPFMGDILRASSEEDPIYFVDKSMDVCPPVLRYAEGRDEIEELHLFSSAKYDHSVVMVHSFRSADSEREVSVKRAVRDCGFDADFIVIERSALPSGEEGVYLALYRVPAGWT